MQIRHVLKHRSTVSIIVCEMGEAEKVALTWCGLRQKKDVHYVVRSKAGLEKVKKIALFLSMLKLLVCVCLCSDHLIVLNPCATVALHLPFSLLDYSILISFCPNTSAGHSQWRFLNLQPLTQTPLQPVIFCIVAMLAKASQSYSASWPC